jgi:hypothetical protein
VEHPPLPGPARGLDVDAPLRESVQQIGRQLAIQRRCRDSLRDRGIEAIDPLRDPPSRESRNDADVMDAVQRNTLIAAIGRLMLGKRCGFSLT